MNVIKDVIFEGRILEQVEKAVDYIKTQMKEKTYLGHDGIFVITNGVYGHRGIEELRGEVEKIEIPECCGSGDLDAAA